MNKCKDKCFNILSKEDVVENFDKLILDKYEGKNEGVKKHY